MPKIHHLEQRLTAAKARLDVAHQAVETEAALVDQLTQKIAKLKRPQGYTTFEEVMAADWHDIERGGFYPDAMNVMNLWTGEHPGLYAGMGIWADTNQRTLSIKLDRSRPLEEQQGAVAALPYLRANGEGVRRLDILEYTLSQHASYHLEIRGEDDFTVKRNWSDEATFTTLEQALEYIYLHHPYRRLTAEEE